MAEEMELLNYAFPLTGPEVTAPIPWPLKWKHGLQVSGAPANPPGIVLLGETKPPAVMTVGKEAKAHSDPSLATVGNNFAITFTHLREDSQKIQNKRPTTSPEQSPQQTKRKRSTESGDSTDSEISKERKMLEITSPRKSGPTRYKQYLAEGGRKLEVRIALPEDYVATSMAPPDDYATGAIPKCPTHEWLGPEVIENMEITELEQGDIADEIYQAQQAHDEELFTWMRCQEEDLKAQEQKKWKEETWQWELRKKKREEEEARKWAAFQKTEEYERQKKRTEKSKDDMERWSILTNPSLEGLSKVPPKPKEMPVACKPSHRSEGKSSGQFNQPPHHLVINCLLDMRRFQYDCLHKRVRAMIA